MKATTLPYVADFFRDMSTSSTPRCIPFDRSTVKAFSRGGGLLICMSQTEADHYDAVVSRLLKEFANTEDMSRDSIESYLQDAMFDTLDREDRSGATFELRLGTALAGLRQRLGQRLELRTCYVPIRGLAAEGLPIAFGRVRFMRVGSRHLRELRARHGLDGTTLGRMLKDGASWQEPFAVVDVQAKDDRAAMDLARRETRRTLDALNYLSSMLQSERGCAYLPGEAERGNHTTLVSSRAGIMLSGGWYGPPHDLSLEKVRAEPSLRAIRRRVDGLLREDPRSKKLADVLCTAVAWAGRASVEPKREQAFLLFAIALETLVLPKSDKDELTYRIKTRVAHLLGQSVDARLELSASVGKLYQTRSKVVHSGSYEVSAEQLGSLQQTVRGCLLRVLLHRKMRHFSTVDQLDEWFNVRALR